MSTLSYEQMRAIIENGGSVAYHGRLITEVKGLPSEVDLVLASGGVAFIGAGFWTIYGSAMADVIDHDELQSGQRREGSFAACGSWISKVGLALGNSASGWVLMFTGFDAKLPAQSEEAIFLIRVFLSGIPICGLLVALFVVSRYFLTEQRMHEIRQALEARRGTV